MLLIVKFKRRDVNKLKKELLSKKEPKLEDLENSQPMHIVKKFVCYRDSIKFVDRQQFAKEITGM